MPFRPNPEEDAERAERIRQARLAQQGRESGVFFQLALRNSGALPDTSTKLAATSANASSGNPFDAISVAGSSTNTSLQLNRNNDQNLQGRKLDFLNQKANGKIYNPHKLQTPASPYQIMAGTIISASLITGINSDLPGNVIAQVTENVYDTATGGHLWIPQGSRMMGTYDSVVAFGQERALLVWQRIILPDGSSIVIDNLPGTDTAGYAGLEDKVNFHTWKLLKGIVLSTLPSIPHLRLLLICVKCTLTILHDLHSIFPKRLKCCVDPLKPPVNAELKSALQDYAEIYRQTYGGKETLADLIPFILESFISADHGFKRARRELTNLRPSSLSNQERET